MFHWGSLYQASLRLEDHVTPILRKVVAATGEDVSFFKKVGKGRVVLFHEPSPHPVRIHLHVGALLPLDSGAAGRVLELFDGSRKRVPESPLMATFGDRKADIAAIAVPIFGHAGTLEGALSVGASPRIEASMAMGIATDASSAVAIAAIPFIGFVAPPQEAANIEGTLVEQAVGRGKARETLRIGMPSGVLQVSAAVRRDGQSWLAQHGSFYRTARRLFEGFVHI